MDKYGPRGYADMILFKVWFDSADNAEITKQLEPLHICVVLCSHIDFLVVFNKQTNKVNLTIFSSVSLAVSL